MKIMAFSDLHGSPRHAEALCKAARDADLVIGAGDFCNMRQGLARDLGLLSDITAPVVLVPGNAESAEELRAVARPGIQVLHGEGCEIDGLHLFGLGYGVPPTPFGGWSCDLDEETAARMLEPCQRADIMILHSPPKGVGDVTSTGLSVGSQAIRAAIERIQPKLAVCGHIHDSWGARGMIGRCEVVNLGPTAHWFEMEIAS